MPLLCVGFAVDFLRSNALRFLLVGRKDGFHGGNRKESHRDTDAETGRMYAARSNFHGLRFKEPFNFAFSAFFAVNPCFLPSAQSNVAHFAAFL